MSANRLVPLFAGLVVLLLVVVLLKSCDPSPHSKSVLDRVPTAPAPDADTPADTIKTLTANVAAMTAEVDALRRDNRDLHQQNQALSTDRDALTAQIRQQVQRAVQDLDRPTADPAFPSAIARLNDRLDALAGEIATQQATRHDDMPIGLGPLDIDENEVVWIAPLDGGPGQGNGQASGNSLLQRLSRATRMSIESPTIGDAPDSALPITARLAAPRPVYTVPRNATLLGSTTLTALVGRVPIDGQVHDPMPFKVITGADNLAANGLTLPGVQGMVWSGTAVGDWTLSCVSGRLDAVTFVFDDGTIRTLSAERGPRHQGKQDALGWISDTRGVPCVSGERKTNAAAYLSQRLGVSALEALAEAAAAGETSTRTTDNGDVTRQLTGDVATYALGKSVAGGSNALADWLAARQAQQFDAVFVAAGTPVVLHVDRELAIDFDPNGRRLSHDTLHTAAPTWLD